MFVRPTIPVSCGALIRDGDGRILILRPTYKSGWTIPGGMMEPDGETPWEACQREVREETGLVLERGRLAVVDTRGASEDEPLGIRFLFDCETVSPKEIDAIRLQAEEISAFRFAEPEQALELLRGRVSRRVKAALEHRVCVYLEDGHSVVGVPATPR